MGLLVCTVVVIILWIMAIIDYHDDPPSGIDGGML
jgi:hypothetical protein